MQLPDMRISTSILLYIQNLQTAQWRSKISVTRTNAYAEEYGNITYNIAYDFFSIGLNINSGRTYLSKSSSLRAFSSMALAFNVMPFLCAFFATFDAAS